MSYGELLNALDHAVLPVVLPDEDAPGGVPVVSLAICDKQGAVLPHMMHLFHVSSHIRACALIGLTIGAHRCWHEHQATSETGD